MLKFFKAMRDEIEVVRKENDALKAEIVHLTAKIEHLENVTSQTVNNPDNDAERITVQRILDEWLNGKENENE
jgi:phosphoglycerate-specific signal transduction histidine kinase